VHARDRANVGAAARELEHREPAETMPDRTDGNRVTDPLARRAMCRVHARAELVRLRDQRADHRQRVRAIAKFRAE
jgi:hypothetical protein